MAEREIPENFPAYLGDLIHVHCVVLRSSAESVKVEDFQNKGEHKFSKKNGKRRRS